MAAALPFNCALTTTALTGRLLLVRDGETLAQEDKFRFINETHVLVGHQIYETSPVGENFRRLALFASSFPETMLERCLSLFVMPRSLLFNWQREIERFCPALGCRVYHGANRDLDAALRGHLVLTTYGTLRGSIEQFMERQFYYVILDESQAIKNSAPLPWPRLGGLAGDRRE